MLSVRTDAGRRAGVGDEMGHGGVARTRSIGDGIKSSNARLRDQAGVRAVQHIADLMGAWRYRARAVIVGSNKADGAGVANSSMTEQLIED